MRPSLVPLLCALALAACKPPSTTPERIELSPAELSLQFGEAQGVTAVVAIGTQRTSLEGLTWASSDETIAAVTAGEAGTATVRGLAGGTATVTARVREASATLTVNVAPRVLVLERLELTPVDAMVARGLRVQLHATGVYDDGSQRDLTSAVAWASADGTRATISSGGLATAVNTGTVELRALKDGVTGRATLTVTAASAMAIDVRPQQASLAKGTSQQFSASARLSDATTQDVSGQVTWASSDAAVASVDGAGRLTANEEGAATLTATLDALSGSALVTVTAAVLQTLEVTPGSVALPLGSTRQLSLTGHFSDGTQQDVTSQASWRSGTLAVATVSPAGLVTAVGLGLSVVTATVDGISAGSSITCTAAQLAAIEVAPQGLSLARGLSRSFTATGLYTDATTRDLTGSVIWSSSDSTVASVVAGLVDAHLEGTATISATNGALTGDGVITVTPALLVSVQVSPLTATLAQGLTRQVTALGTFSDGSTRDVTAELTWTSSAPAATVSNAPGSEGLVTGAAVGSATITGTAGLVFGTTSITVGAPVLQRLDVTAPAASLAKGRTQQLTATGVYSDGSTQDLTSSATWAPASGAVISVSGAGLLTAVQVGTASATATVGAVVGSLSQTVTAAELDSLTLSPAAPTLALGLSQALVAQGHYSDGTTQPLSTGLTWSSASPGVATVSAAGLVESVTEGQTLVTAASGSLSGATLVTVGPPALTTITVTPASPTLEKTETLQLAADGLYTDGSTAVLTALVTWGSAAPGVASVSSTGALTGNTPGTSAVSATLGAVSGSTTVTVNRPALLSLAVTPSPANVERGLTLAFTAVATYVDGSTETVTSLVSWSTSDGSIATVSSAGVALGVLDGTTTITAAWGAASTDVQLTVDPLSLLSVVITGSARVAKGAATQLTATGTFSDSSTSEVTALVTWASSAPATARLTNLAGVRGVAEGLAAGSASISASLGSVSSAAFPLLVVDTNAPYAGRCGPGLVISQVYGGGGNAGATWRNDFVELHNPGATAISLSGLSLQYGSAGGTTWGNRLNLANTSVPPGGYYLVQFASSGAVGALLPTADQVGTIDLAGASGKIALVNGTAALTGACPTAGVLDFAGYGSANCSEGATAPGLSASTWLVRGVSGCRDANANATDFTTTTTVSPRTMSASPPLFCSCFANGLAAAPELNACVLQSPASLGTIAGGVTPAVSALVTEPGVTDTAGFDPSLQVQVGFGPSGANPTTAASWRWWPAPGQTAGSTSDGYDGVFVAPSSGTWGFTARATVDGVNWTACDLNGAGRSTGLALELGQLGVLAVP